MVSLTRRQMLIGGVAFPFLSAIAWAAGKKLILSGRVVNTDGKPLSGLAVGETITDADGRFMLVTSTAAGRWNAQRDEAGTWRATVGFTR